MGVFKRRVPQFIGAIAACFGGFSLGCCIGWSAPAVVILERDHGFGTFENNLIGSSLAAGGTLGVITVPFLIDLIGRKWTMISVTPFFVAGWALIVFGAANLLICSLGRALTGACGAMFCVAAPIYAAEIAEKEVRGCFGVMFQLLLVLGILYSYLTGYLDSLMWTSVLCGCAPIAFAMIMFFVPESPFYYLMSNQEENARKSMLFFRGKDFDMEPELNAFKEIVAAAKEEKGTLKALVDRRMRRVLLVAYGLMITQQLCGINAVIYYGKTIFQWADTGMNTQMQLVVVGGVQVLACLVSAGLTDYLGRRLLMIISESLMALCLAALAVFFTNPEKNRYFAWLPLASTCTYIVAFSLGAGPIPWAYMGEIFPAKLKGTASSSSAFLNWALAFAVTLSFGTLNNLFGSTVIFGCFAVICIICAVFIGIFMVETKGKTFEQIQREYGQIAD